MTEPQRVGTLEITQDERFQEREWKVQRIGWVLMALVVVLALLGVFGTGPLSAVEQETSDGSLAVDYQRFIRNLGNTTLTIEADASLAENGQMVLWISSDWIEAMELERISPMPDQVREAGDRHVMVFLVEDRAGTLTVSFTARPQDLWLVSGEAGLVDGPSIDFDQFSYP